MSLPQTWHYKPANEMTTRARIATEAMAAMIQAEWSSIGDARINPAQVAKDACDYAEALISELRERESE